MRPSLQSKVHCLATIEAAEAGAAAGGAGRPRVDWMLLWAMTCAMRRGQQLAEIAGEASSDICACVATGADSVTLCWVRGVQQGRHFCTLLVMRHWCREGVVHHATKLYICVLVLGFS